MALQSESKLIFTYGTLKRGFPNHPLLSRVISTRHSTFLCSTTTLSPFPLVIGPHGIPFLINLPGSGHRVIGELYSVSPLGLPPLDDLEGTTTGHYQRLPVEVVADGGDVVAAEGYFADESFGVELWKKCGEEGVEEYTLEMSQKYVRKSERDPHSDFVKDVWKFISYNV